VIFFAAGYAYGRIPYQLYDRHYPMWAVVVQGVAIILLCASAVRSLRRQVLDRSLWRLPEPTWASGMMG